MTGDPERIVENTRLHSRPHALWLHFMEVHHAANRPEKWPLVRHVTFVLISEQVATVIDKWQRTEIFLCAQEGSVRRCERGQTMDTKTNEQGSQDFVGGVVDLWRAMGLVGEQALGGSTERTFSRG